MLVLARFIRKVYKNVCQLSFIIQQQMLIRQKNRQIQSFLRKHSSHGKIHQICCKGQNEERSIDQRNKKIKQNHQRITLKRQGINGNQTKKHQDTSKHPHDRAYSAIFSTQQLNNFTSHTKIVSPLANSFTKICFNYPKIQVKNQELLPTTETLPILWSQLQQRKFQDHQISYQSLDQHLRVPRNQAQSASRIGFTMLLQNPTQALASNLNSDKIIQGKMMKITQLKEEGMINQHNLDEKMIDNSKITVEGSQSLSFDQSKNERGQQPHRKQVEN